MPNIHHYLRNALPELSELELIEQQLKELEVQRQKLLIRKQELQSQSKEALALSSRQKVELFMNLFQGRIDAHAFRWQNQ